MAELRVMDALREKRSELSGVVSRLEQQLAQHRGSLAHLDATMRLFDPDLLSQDADPAPQWERVSWFRPGECRRLIYGVLLLEFFTAQINDDHTRKAYLNATRRFADWCAAHGLHQLDQVQAFHVAAFVKHLQGQFTPPTVKQHLAALRMLLDWLVTGHVIAVNPAHAVRGPKYVVKKGKTPVLQADEARALLAAIDTGPLIGYATGR
jgi:integrase